MRGHAALQAITQEQVSQLSALLGNDCFEPGAVFSLSAPESLFIVGRTQLKAGESEQYRVVAFGTKGKMEGEAEFKVISSDYESFYNFTKDGLLTTDKITRFSNNLTIRVLFKPAGELSIEKEFNVYINPLRELSSVRIGGEPVLYEGKENLFTAELSPVKGLVQTEMTPQWILFGEGADTRLQIVEPTLTSCKVKVLDATPADY